MPSSSNSIVLKRKLTGARIAAHDGGGLKAIATPGRFDLKEIQRRAFERGQAVERERGSKSFAAIAETLKRQLAEESARRAADRARVEEFAARLALMVAEKLVHRSLAAQDHDVAGLVTELLAELGPAAEGGMKLRLSPSDHKLLLDAAARGELDLTGIDAAADPGMKPGGAVLANEEIEYWSSLNDRIERLREAVLKEANHA